jgi:hypothetical protein
VEVSRRTWEPLGRIVFCRHRSNSLCTSVEHGAGVDCVLGAWSSRRLLCLDLYLDIEGGPRGRTRLEVLGERYRYGLRDVLFEYSTGFLAIFLFS